YLLLFLTPRPRPLRSPPFPYTTLFRSRFAGAHLPHAGFWENLGGNHPRYSRRRREQRRTRRSREKGIAVCGHGRVRKQQSLSPRSEEHTSELQSRFDLVCRLLLEKKKK